MRAFEMKRTLLLTLLLVILLVMAFVVWSLMNGNDHRTNDAYINADYTLVAPKVSGYVSSVQAQDNQQVKAGQLLATLDDRQQQQLAALLRQLLQAAEQ